MDIQLFENLGFSKKEAAIYLACLELGESNASAIAKKAGIQRTDCFGIASKMANRGLLEQKRRGRDVLFKATSPERLASLQEQRAKMLKDSVPELLALSKNSLQKKEKITHFEGSEGLDEISRRASFSGGELLVFTAKEFLTKENGIYQGKHVAERKKHKTYCRTIIGMSTEAISHRNIDVDVMRETRMLPLNLFDAETTVGIYQKKVFVMNYKKHFGFIVEDENFANTLSQIFELIWNSGKIIE